MEKSAPPRKKESTPLPPPPVMFSEQFLMVRRSICMIMNMWYYTLILKPLGPAFFECITLF